MATAKHKISSSTYLTEFIAFFTLKNIKESCQNPCSIRKKSIQNAADLNFFFKW